MTIDFLASEPHFQDHIEPIIEALPEEVRGVYMKQKDDGLLANLNGPVLVRSVGDATRCALAGRPVIYAEHGCGISYGGDPAMDDHRSYAGGEGKEHAIQILVPGQYPYERQREAYPETDIRKIGCPKLDQYLSQDYERSDPPVVAFGWHWDCRACPETRTAFPHFKDAVADLAGREDMQLLGHGHPRMISEIHPWYQSQGIEWTEDFSEVMKQADIYVCDNSSTICEFAATGRPVLVLNAPWYRRDVHHGLRFWEHAEVGVNCDRPEDLLDSIKLAEQDPAHQKRNRREAVEAVYEYTDGRSSERAASAILEALERYYR